MSSIERDGTQGSIELSVIKKKLLGRRKNKCLKKNILKGKKGSKFDKRRSKC
jgi:hypothetical protein